MPRIWTHGVWTVKPGREDEFVEAWRATARAVLAELDSAGAPHLLRDRERPNVFLSFGPWDDLGQVERFRAFIRPRLDGIRELVESLELHTLDDVPFDG